MVTVENGKIVGNYKEPAEKASLNPADTKESIELQLSKRLRELQYVYSSTITNDGDDSSDDEEIEGTVGEFNYPPFNFNSIDFSQLAHAIGLKLYWSTEVNRLYYKEKAEMLKGNIVNLSPTELKSWMSNSIDNFGLCCNKLAGLRKST